MSAPSVPHAAEGEVACAREGCGDGYTRHQPASRVCSRWGCPCLGFLWVPPAGPVPEDRAP